MYSPKQPACDKIYQPSKKALARNIKRAALMDGAQLKR
jgi:hypothetical protein